MDKLISASDKVYMARALQLAAYGAGHVSPNPMVGAVVTARGRIIGEGWHRQYGRAHAEVNAIASVREADKWLLPEATIYVTLEPCSHYGKTPPCARLLIDKGVRRVVTGSPDPNPLVAGRGIKMLREAGIEVTENVMREECDNLNRRFLTAQTLRRPWIQLKWACSADGYMGSLDAGGNPASCSYSNTLSRVLMHKERSMADAIMVGTGTVIADNPRLSLRDWPGRDPQRVTFRSPRIPESSHILQGNCIFIDPTENLTEAMHSLFAEENISSLMVEGGATLLKSFIEAGLYDEIRIERTSEIQGSGVKAPSLPEGVVKTEENIVRGNTITIWRR